MAHLALAFLGQGAGHAFQPLSGNFNAHDPSRLIKDGNRYYFFRTAPGIGINWSSDLRTWNSAGTVFPVGQPPAWTTNAVPDFDGNIWAPDVAYFNGRYHVYYSISSWGTIDSAIGLVTTPSLISPVWTDHGKVVQSDATWEAGPDTDLTAYNCIDPSILQDTNGTIWMVFGSYSDGILVMQLDPTTGKRITPTSPITRIANNGPNFFSNTTEGASVYQRGGYYWLFLNFGGCCSGVNSSYNIRVGRSANVTGPYIAKNGATMLTGGGTMFLETTGRFIGPGHGSIMDDNGTNWFTYHYYDGTSGGGTARFGIAQLRWGSDGWPVLTNDWSAFYTFDADGREHRGQFNGTLRNGATIENVPGRGGVLHLDGSSNRVTLPLTIPNANTFAAWVKWNGGSDWQRILDFGSNTTKYLFLTPRAGNGRMRLALRNGGAEQVVDAPAALPTNSWAHVAVTLDGTRASLYLNGNPVATGNNIAIRPWQLFARSNYLGASQFTNDPGFNGRIDSLRVFGRALSSNEIRELAWAQPGLAHRYSFKVDARDSIGMAHGLVLGDASVTNEVLRLPGTSAFVQLPGGLASVQGALTAEVWASFNVNGTWSRVFDFGSVNGTLGQNYVFYSAKNNSGGQRMEISTSVRTVTADVPVPLDNRTVHVVCVFDPAAGVVSTYTNGVLQVTQPANLPPLTGVNGTWGFIGRSLFSADGWLDGDIDEFRLYDGRLTPDEVAANFAAGPDALALPLLLTLSNEESAFELAWASHGIGFALESAAAVNGDWQPVGGQPTLVNDEWRVNLPVAPDSQYFRLKR